ncbi:hypothetical protein PRBRB14_25420 [Hallella multisaccharivorax DSM 17128]|uniref:hypothetical protein n=1 Tax=Hallella multisaccharivorax TaxID=310514 RepID=UPI0012EACA81|nr:hypothetical protein [Hallella multisaccharivorax]GJG31663.1 hypothetical protein PRBRB14_25420 [Hallella multisaccharivorax DSM 17128]
MHVGDSDTDWSHVYVHNRQVEKILRDLSNVFKQSSPGEHLASFVHKSYRIANTGDINNGPVNKFQPTIPGRVFLQSHC